jgi:UDP-N-acetyl-2-amino-2-deoxyglucuronate dehydrogenase
MKNFALIGAAGYIASRHMKAIKEIGCNLIAAMDPNDSVGILDSFFPNTDFFVEFERFDRHVEKLKRSKSNNSIDFVSICSPNYLHDSHIRFALRSGANAICEKPIVLNSWNIDALKELEVNTNQRVYTILQLRLHPSIIALKKKVDSAPINKIFDVDLTYITSRGKWYQYSWKGDEKKSGGVATNIGVHFYDMLHFIFGNVKQNIVHHRDEQKVAGFLEYDKARVRWFLSVDSNDLPINALEQNLTTYRSLTIDNTKIEFSDGFKDLHTKVYQEILLGNGFGLEENRSAIDTVSEIRRTTPIGIKGEYHPQLNFIKNA